MATTTQTVTEATTDATFGRYAEIPVNKMTSAPKRAYDYVVEQRGKAPGPYKIWIQNTEVLNLMVPLGVYYKKHSSLNDAEREIATNLVVVHIGGHDCGTADLVRRSASPNYLRSYLGHPEYAIRADGNVSTGNRFDWRQGPYGPHGAHWLLLLCRFHNHSLRRLVARSRIIALGRETRKKRTATMLEGAVATQKYGLGGRLPLLRPENLPPAQKPNYDRLISGMIAWAKESNFQASNGNGTLIGPFDSLLYAREPRVDCFLSQTLKRKAGH